MHRVWPVGVDAIVEVEGLSLCEAVAWCADEITMTVGDAAQAAGR